jgi:hypothetical protein
MWRRPALRASTSCPPVILTDAAIHKHARDAWRTPRAFDVLLVEALDGCSTTSKTWRAFTSAVALKATQ